MENQLASLPQRLPPPTAVDQEDSSSSAGATSTTATAPVASTSSGYVGATHGATTSHHSKLQTAMCRQLKHRRMDNEEAICEDKATSTDDELLVSSSNVEDHISTDITAVAQLWGADLVGLIRPRHLRPHKKALYQQESVSSASDVSRTRSSHKPKKQKSQENEENGAQLTGKPKELRKQWTTDSSDSGYSKNYSRERLRRQDTEESAESSKKIVKELQRQPTTESSSSVRLTRQSSLRSGSDNQSLFLMRQSTIETYDEFSTTDFSRPQSSNSTAYVAGPVVPPVIHVESPHCSKDDSQDVPSDHISYIQAPDPIVEEKPAADEFSAIANVPNNTGVATSLLTSMSCSLINLSAIELEASQINDIQQSLICANKIQKVHARRRKRRRQLAKRAAKVYRSREKVRPQRNNPDDLPKKVRWSIMATGLVLFLMSIILVGATLRMAPLIDEMGEYSNIFI